MYIATTQRHTLNVGSWRRYDFNIHRVVSFTICVCGVSCVCVWVFVSVFFGDQLKVCVASDFQEILVGQAGDYWKQKSIQNRLENTAYYTVRIEIDVFVVLHVCPNFSISVFGWRMLNKYRFDVLFSIVCHCFSPHLVGKRKFFFLCANIFLYSTKRQIGKYTGCPDSGRSSTIFCKKNCITGEKTSGTLVQFENNATNLLKISGDTMYARLLVANKQQLDKRSTCKIVTTRNIQSQSEFAFKPKDTFRLYNWNGQIR